MPPDPQAARRRMNLMASVSRSSGLEKDGDDLKNYKIQEEYRNFIQEKLDTVFARHTERVHETEAEKRQRIDAQENLLILFRKLREGIYSSGRNDEFAMEAYETSLYLSVIFESPKQTASIIPHLLTLTHTSTSSSSAPSPSKYSVLVSLLHHLATSYPSQSTYNQQLDSLPSTLLPRRSIAAVWLASLAKSLRTRNYASFEALSRKKSVLEVVQESHADKSVSETSEPTGTGTQQSNLASRALSCLIASLRRKSGDTAWVIIRSAYREIACDQAAKETRNWLTRSLSLDSVVAEELSLKVDDWLEQKASLGHVRRKEGVEGRWIICKVR
ncbi:hypothetical protein B0H34DRAFT_655909 [Crassisporium funariophilum]|nr:hypothetical protein B0H34DRAFT_655909 [Crassisporium funariophilum]